MKYKGFTKLTIQIGLLSISMIVLSLFTDTQVWLNYFSFEIQGDKCIYEHHIGYLKSSHYHSNYRGVVYTITGIVYFIMSVIRIAMSHKESDFK